MTDFIKPVEKVGWAKYLEKLPPIYKNLPQLSIKERDRRWKRIREEMSLWGLDCLLVWGNNAFYSLTAHNFRYITAMSCVGPCVVVFPIRGDPIAYVGTPHNHYHGASYTWVSDVRPVATAEDIITIVKELGFEKAKIGQVGDTLWPHLLYHLWSDIQRGMPEVNFIDALPLLWGLQLIKSPEEVRCLEEAGRIAGLVYKAMLETVRPGVKECEVYATMQHAMISNGGESDTMILIDSGNPVLPHPRYPPPTTRTLENGDIFMAEYHTSYAGYQTHTERCISIGQPRKEYVEIFKVCKESYTAGVDKLRSGVSLKEAVEAQRAPVYKAGMDHLECGFHTHGLASAGFPSFNKSDAHLDEIASAMIKENMVFANMVDLFNPKWADGGGITLGDTFLVTEDGPRRLTDIPLELAVI